VRVVGSELDPVGHSERIEPEGQVLGVVGLLERAPGVVHRRRAQHQPVAAVAEVLLERRGQQDLHESVVAREALDLLHRQVGVLSPCRTRRAAAWTRPRSDPANPSAGRASMR
jgi:hypothetical protein